MRTLNECKMSKKKSIIRRQNLQDDSSGESINYFLGIGIDEYEHQKNLNNAVRDVQMIHDALCNRYLFSKDDDFSKILLNEEATKENIEKVLYDYARTLGENDSLIVYYSGHGYLAKKFGNVKKGYWIPYNGENPEKDSEKCISNNQLIELFSNIKAKHLLLITDSCFSGSLLTRGEEDFSVGLNKIGNMTSRRAICSSLRDEPAYDGIDGGNSPFASSLLRALNENIDSQISTHSIYINLNDYFPSDDFYGQNLAYDPLKIPGENRGQFVFKLKDDVVYWLNNKLSDAENTLSNAYKAFINRFPNSCYLELAKENAVISEDRENWQLASESGTVLAFRDYLNTRSIPQDKKIYVEQATILIDQKLNESKEKWKVLKKEIGKLISNHKSSFLGNDIPLFAVQTNLLKLDDPNYNYFQNSSGKLYRSISTENEIIGENKSTVSNEVIMTVKKKKGKRSWPYILTFMILAVIFLVGLYFLNSEFASFIQKQIEFLKNMKY